MTEAQDSKEKGKDNLAVSNSPETNITSLTHNHGSDQACAMALLRKGNNPRRKETVKTS